jgi:hypothetical protein
LTLILIDSIIIRDDQNGLLMAVSDGTLNTAIDYSGYGEITTQETRINTQPFLTWDNTGRITQKT